MEELWSFDSGSQKMKCPFCDTEVSIEEFEQEQKKIQRKHAGKLETMEHNGKKMKFLGMAKALFFSQSRGGEITVTKNNRSYDMSVLWKSCCSPKRPI